MNIKETETYWVLFGWAKTLHIRTSLRWAILPTQNNKSKPWQRLVLGGLQTISPKLPRP